MEEYIISINGKPKFRCPSRIDAEMTVMLLSFSKRVDPVKAKLQAIDAKLASAKRKYRELEGEQCCSR